MKGGLGRPCGPSNDNNDMHGTSSLSICNLILDK